jgi:NADPH:quinone reductase-like Zn-dependent oxidoreductase
MKAAVYRRYGPPDVVRIEEVEKPVPGNDEVVLRVRAASVNPLDWHYMRGSPFFLRLGTGIRRPKDVRLGVDVAGEIEAAGAGVRTFGPGDAVFGTCRGAFAEYACAPVAKLVAKPADTTFDQAASAGVAGFTALQAIRDKGRVRSGQRVLVNGAAGGVGTFAVQVAKALGAEVTAVCGTKGIELVRSLGADHVIDYTGDDLARCTRRHDVILDCAASRPFSAWRRVMTPAAIYLPVGMKLGGHAVGLLLHLVGLIVSSRFVSQRVVFFVAKANSEELDALKVLVEAGRVTPVVEGRYSLSTAAEAIRHLKEGHARGKVVISVA